MTYTRPYLSLPDDQLLQECDIHIYKASGPGGQHRNKVSSAVRLRHRPTGISAHGDDSRSQHTNKRLALLRLQMNIACRYRIATNPEEPQGLPEVVRSCMFASGTPGQSGKLRLAVGKRDHRFWHVAAVLLDILATSEGSVSSSARVLAITTANFTSLLSSHRHLFVAAQEIRKRFGLRPLR